MPTAEVSNIARKMASEALNSSVDWGNWSRRGFFESINAACWEKSILAPGGGENARKSITFNPADPLKFVIKGKLDDFNRNLSACPIGQPKTLPPAGAKLSSGE